MKIQTLRVLYKIQSALLEQLEIEDCKQSTDDIECGVIEGKIAAYRDSIIRISSEIDEAL